MTAPRYAELQVTSPFSFLRGASSAEELFAQVALYGIEALGITDHHSLAGIVRAHEAAKATGVRLVVGSRLDLADGTAVLAYPTDRAAYARLCRLLTKSPALETESKPAPEVTDPAQIVTAPESVPAAPHA